MDTSLFALRAATGVLVLVANLAGVAARAQPTADASPVFEVVCLCQNGHDPARFSGEIAVTDENRAALQARIETGVLALRRNVVLRASACAPRPWNPRDGATCGSSDLQVRLPNGERQTTRADNVVAIGDRRIRITGTSNITTRSDMPEGVIALDSARWARVRVVTVSGVLAP
jgi:hypothetical protein